MRILRYDAPKYGNNDAEIDTIARHILTYFCEEVGQYRNLRGEQLYREHIPTQQIFRLERIAVQCQMEDVQGMPIAEACSPTHNVEKNGPTQAALSVAHLDSTLVTNGTQYNQKYHPNTLKGEEGNSGCSGSAYENLF